MLKYVEAPSIATLAASCAAVRIRKYAGASALLTFEQFCLLMEFLKDAQGYSMKLVHSQLARSCEDHGMASTSTMCCAPEEQKKKFTAVDQDRSQAAH